MKRMDTSAIEYKICELLSMLNDESTKGFWCDGVALCENESHYTKKYVNDHRFIKLKAYIGKIIV